VLDGYRLEFQSTQDPLAMWAAYHLCRLAALPIPEWIMAELHQTAKRLLEVASSRTLPSQVKQRHWTRDVAQAVGFRVTKSGGPSDPFTVKNAPTGEYLATRMRIFVDGEGLNQTDACYLIAKELDISEATVRRAWRRLAQAVRVADLDSQRYEIEVLHRQMAEANSLHD
jgi:hypothetical protein